MESSNSSSRECSAFETGGVSPGGPPSRSPPRMQSADSTSVRTKVDGRSKKHEGTPVRRFVPRRYGVLELQFEETFRCCRPSPPSISVHLWFRRPASPEGILRSSQADSIPWRRWVPRPACAPPPPPAALPIYPRTPHRCEQRSTDVRKSTREPPSAASCRGDMESSNSSSRKHSGVAAHRRHLSAFICGSGGRHPRRGFLGVARRIPSPGGVGSPAPRARRLPLPPLFQSIRGLHIGANKGRRTFEKARGNPRPPLRAAAIWSPRTPVRGNIPVLPPIAAIYQRSSVVPAAGIPGGDS